MATMQIDPNRRFTFWSWGEHWTGPNGTGDFVPNPNDLIYDPATDFLYKVINVNYTSGISQKQQINFREISGANEGDILIGVGPGTPSAAWRVSVNLQTAPFEARTDTRMYVNGTEAAFMKLFKNTNFDDAGAVISGMYDQNGDWISDQVPVQGTGALRTLPKFYLKESVEHGQPVYALIYNAAGVNLATYAMLINVTDHIPSGTAAVKHVTGIELISNMLSQTQVDTLEVPKNFPLNSILASARVHYSDGTNAVHPINGAKFTLLNLQPFLAAVTDQETKVRLKYVLGSDENGDGVYGNNGERFITRQYTVKVTPTDYSYSVKLFNFLDWDSAVNRYNMVSYLYTLSRDESWNVTQHRRFSMAGAPFTGTPGGALLDHIVNIDMEDVDPSYTNFRYTQLSPVQCAASGISSDVRWRVKNNENAADPWDVPIAELLQEPGQYRIDLAGDNANLNEWLDNNYYAHGPLFDSEEEAQAPAPTHFRIILGSATSQVAINQWNASIIFPTAEIITTGRLLMVEFLRIDGSDTQVLGAGGFSVTRI